MVARTAADAAGAAEGPPYPAHGDSAITVSPPIMVWPTTTKGSIPVGEVEIGAAAEADDSEPRPSHERVAHLRIA